MAEGRLRFRRLRRARLPGRAALSAAPRLPSAVLDVDQDALGKQAGIVRHTRDEFILAKPMEDGSLAVGLFNLGEKPKQMAVTWRELGIDGRRTARDIWRQKGAGRFAGEYTVAVNRHGVSLVRFSKQ